MVSRDFIFWEVDVQADFMLPGGNLYVPGAEKLLPNIRRLTDAARQGQSLPRFARMFPRAQRSRVQDFSAALRERNNRLGTGARSSHRQSRASRQRRGRKFPKTFRSTSRSCWKSRR